MKTLVIVAHSNLESSRANRRRVENVKKYSEITVHELYKAYPDWHIDTQREQQLLLEHDRIVFQFPLHWYSTPALLQKWLEDVLAFGWSYGPGGNSLAGKEFILAVTSGGAKEYYRPEGINLFTVEELLRPFQVTIHRSQGKYKLLDVLYGVKNLTDEELDRDAEAYASRILG
ncbi:NAD(P)H-dependent oxidoreductase [Paenibacillus sp. FSL K6-0276]|uniref:NAD(P)H-dependent oxidoreductase n=1 Tax=Paenibacillus sp. FSL K6-0276 TaxID=2921450 RepID=UPI0030EF8B8A